MYKSKYTSLIGSILVVSAMGSILCITKIIFLINCKIRKKYVIFYKNKYKYFKSMGFN